jgi:hypothetical protein
MSPREIDDGAGESCYREIDDTASELRLDEPDGAASERRSTKLAPLLENLRQGSALLPPAGGLPLRDDRPALVTRRW